MADYWSNFRKQEGPGVPHLNVLAMEWRTCSPTFEA